MGDLRRAYRRWLALRLAWLFPGLTLGSLLAFELFSGPPLPLWVRIPSIALEAGALLLLAALGVQSVIVVRSRGAGDLLSARMSRLELRSHRAFALCAVAVLLPLVTLPLLFDAPAPPPPIAAYHPPAPPAEEAEDPLPPEPAIVPDPPEPPPEAAPQAGVPQILPEIAAAPAALNLIDEPAFRFPAPAAPTPDDRVAGRELLDPPQRPGPEDPAAYPLSAGLPKGLDRGGLPDEADGEGWLLPELRLEITFIPQSRRWVGALYEASYDRPIGRDDSLRLAWFSGLLSDQKEDLEPTLSWQRATVEYVRRVAGYTRHATFDFALRLGLTVDRVAEHESALALATTPRLSPWIGIETAVWQQDGFGLVLQGGQSVAVRVTGASASVTDVRLVLRIDWTESVSFQAGYRIFSARLHDHGLADGGVREELEQSFSGPVAGLSVRF